jgi:protein involved in polysaccharide export with SLBB domain
LQDAIIVAGGFTSSAYLYGTRLERISVKQEQAKAIERFKSESRKLVANDSLRKQTTSEDAQLALAYRERIQSVLAALDEIKPEGRLALGVNINSSELPPILLEPGDVITIPSVPNNVTLVGSIPSGQISLAYTSNKNMGEYVNLSGGYNKGADSSQSYIMRASGQFTSATSSWFTSVDSLPVYPGDTIFVPEEMQKTTWMKELKDWAAIFYQLGLGVAAIKILRQ